MPVLVKKLTLYRFIFCLFFTSLNALSAQNIDSLIRSGTSCTDKGKYEQAQKFLEDALKLCPGQKEKELLLAKINVALAAVYSGKGHYDKSLELYLNNIDVLEKKHEKKDLARVFHNIAVTYYHTFKFDESKKYTLKSKALFEELKDTVNVLSSLSLLGTICYGKDDYSGALAYYKESLEQTEKLKNKSYSAINLNGIGTVYADTKRFSEAIPYFERALAIAKEMDNQQAIITCSLNLGICYSGLNDQAEAIKIYNQSLIIAKQIGSKHSTKELYYYLMEAYEKQKDYRSALSSLQQFTIVNDSIYNEESSQQINELTTKYETATKEKEIAVLNADLLAKQKDKEILSAKVKEKNSIIISTILATFFIIIAALLFISRQKLKSKKDKIIFEKQESLLQAEKQKAESELLNAKNLLDSYTEHLIEKNKAVEELQHEIEKLKGLKATEIYEEKIDALDDLNNATILTDEDWEKFKGLFEQVYKGFFIRLKDKLPNLTKAEIRLISLIKLNLDTKQMANMLGVSINTITVTKYRLRKKININEQQDIASLVESI
ncbi:MAG TPA: tetratricopeptide repeat protein [Bacteroidia bacterium]|jgi:tetratricopeptide (TPR) repeat protein|nr:tetratricopeptide repeat protein [Bacteroidia bacterium]